MNLQNNSTDGGSQDARNLSLERGRSSNDRKHNAVISAIWDVNYFDKLPAVPRAVVRGWTVSEIASFRSGTPFNVTSGRDNNLDGVNTDRANLVGIPFLDPHRSRSDVTNAWFNTAAFAQNAAGQVGNRGGLQMMAVYTWSKILDDFSSVGGYGQSYPGYTDHNKRFLDKSLSSLDVAHRLVFNYEYDLPFRPAGRLLKTLIGGWNVNGGTSIQSGMPIPILSLANTTFSQGGAQRPNSTGKSSRTPGGDKDRIDHWFDNTAFVNPPRYTFGNVGRTLPDNRGPALQSWESFGAEKHSHPRVETPGIPRRVFQCVQ